MSQNKKELLLFLVFMLAGLFYVQSQQTFQNVAPQLGITGIIGLGHSVSWGDIDNDGDSDLALGDQAGNGYRFFRNNSAFYFFTTGHFDKWVLFDKQDCPGGALLITLKGVISNFNGIGAQADMWINGQRISRNLLPEPGIQNFTQLRLHFGMGAATEADSLIVYWSSGIVQKLSYFQWVQADLYSLTACKVMEIINQSL